MIALKDRLAYIDAIENLPNPSFVVTAEGCIIDANQAGKRLLGVAAITGKLLLASVVENSATQLHGFLRLCARSRSPIPGKLVWRAANRPEPSRVIGWCASPSSEEQIALIAIQCKNITVDRFLTLNDQLERTQREVIAREQIQTELEAALKARDDFIAVAAHEFRNPLNVLHLTLQLLHRMVAEPAALPKIRGFLEKSRAQLDRLSFLVDRLLDVTRIQAGKLALRREDFDLSDLVNEVVGRHRESNPEATILIESENARGVWDRFRIDQAITNLISNAIKYGMKKPILIKVLATHGEAVIVVQDQGIGLATDDRDRIFNRFERAVPYSYREGLGLGLWITRRIVEAHGGAISAQGELGKGSEFTLRLPRQSN